MEEQTQEINSPMNTLETPTGKEYPPVGLIAFKATDPENPIPVRSLFYEGPKNATVSIGIPLNPEKKIRIAFCGMGGTINHDSLEPITAPSNTDYQHIKAFLRREVGPDGKRQSFLDILVLPEEEVKQLLTQTDQIMYRDPFKILTDPVTHRLCEYFRISEMRFVEDKRQTPTGLEKEKSQTDAPPSGGLEKLKWMRRRRCGD